LVVENETGGSVDAAVGDNLQQIFCWQTYITASATARRIATGAATCERPRHVIRQQQTLIDQFENQIVLRSNQQRTPAAVPKIGNPFLNGCEWMRIERKRAATDRYASLQ
jgi:hypothetical protein